MAVSMHETAEKAMMDLINSQDRFTFRDLHSAGDRAVKLPGFSYRPADRLLQRLRGEGVIELASRHVWRKVDA